MYPLNGTYESTGEVRPPKTGELYLFTNIFPDSPKKVVRCLDGTKRITSEVIMREITQEVTNG